MPDDRLGAFCRDNHIALRGSGMGPLAGLTFGVKDLFHIRGARTGFGHPDWLRTHPPATETAEAVQQLLDAGANMVGKTHTDELAYSLTGENVHYGTPVNPRDPRRIPGGSSNGSVAAVAGGLVDFALGSDCGGSVRLPASYCGVLGMRPTHGRVSLRGAIPFGPSFDVAGWFARDPEVFERVGRVLLGDDSHPDQAQRLLVATDAFELVNGAVAEALQPALGRLAAMFRIVERAVVSRDGLRSWFEVFRTLQAAEVWSNHGEWVSRVKPQLGPGVKERFEWASTVTVEAVAVHQQRRAAIRHELAALLRPRDVLCLPTSPRIAPFKHTPTDKVEVEYRNQAMCLLCIAGLGGLPQISLPLAALEHMPLGLSVIGSSGTDVQLLQLAAELMRTSG
ncbi:MAG: amidase [Gammaproteobacteria bacterium]|nr:amidase [Gammaproteobacteria bacterium]NIR83208.1 amidase [Gammaproteobacteria bacterium]NIR91016.1 amidase [Gammaproteobacteria bacterium]NIU04373.1 amidase [Gammaproteobacteria bacterium]NIV52596.1 amidase [Gammaproteobacteria bacterium]